MRPVPSDQLADGLISPLHLQGGRLRQVGEDQREDTRGTSRVSHAGRLEGNRWRVPLPRVPPSRRRGAPSPCAHVRGRTSIAGPAGEVLRRVRPRIRGCGTVGRPSQRSATAVAELLLCGIRLSAGRANQCVAKGAAHSPQKLASAGFSTPQLMHRIDGHSGGQNEGTVDPGASYTQGTATRTA
jgi:hypothetical protein